ncbi:MAG: hypothetical protein CL992_00990 [Euryarchaeota archaeon]|nr:hypothetical protein [Euryarchaeota archaeon]
MSISVDELDSKGDKPSDTEVPSIDLDESNIMTLRNLVGTLLARETIAHVMLVVSASVVIHTLTRIGILSLDTAAVIFISLSAAYSLTAVAAQHESIGRMIRASPVTGGTRVLTAVAGSLLMPIIIAGVIAGTILASISGDGVLSTVGTMHVFPWLLAIMFCVWSLMQAAAFRVPAETMTVKLAPLKVGTNGFDSIRFRRRVTIIIVITATILHILFFSIKPWIDPTKESPSWFQAVIMGPEGAFPFSGLAFVITCGIITDLVLRRQTGRLNELGSHKSGQRRALVWSIIVLGFVAWHLFSFHRKFILGSDDIIEIAEEVILMIITVLSAMWALSNRAKGDMHLFTPMNAVFWATAFAYGYAGSISIISNGLLGGELNPIQALGMGHLVTAIGLCAVHASGIDRFRIQMDECSTTRS